jgi:hypothetical protein
MILTLLAKDLFVKYARNFDLNKTVIRNRANI